MPFQVGLLLFPDITQLDLTGPYEVFIKFPQASVHLIWKNRDPVTAGGGMQILPTMTFADCPQLDLICVPGGSGINPLLNDPETLAFIRVQAKGARYVTSVCTGALVLGGPAHGQARHDALDEPGDAGPVWCDTRGRAVRCRWQRDYRRRCDGRYRFCPRSRSASLRSRRREIDPARHRI
jgi:putative intracellular protease/amidase